MFKLESGSAVEWASIVRGLKKCGWSQLAVAEALGCSQAAISQLNTGRHSEPTYSLGVKLLALHEYVGAGATVKSAASHLPGREAVPQSTVSRTQKCARPTFAPPLHVPGDTTTPAASGAVWIGTGDA